MDSEKERFLKSWENEFQITLKVLKAYPANRQEFKPHEIMKTAKDLAWVFASEERTMLLGAINGNMDFANRQATPATMGEVISEYEKTHREIVQKYKDAPEEELNKNMKFFTGPKTMGDIRKLDVLWGLLMDQAHHRGQFSIYLRMAGGKVPSIYGPSADEPW
jgi:uncharacterized damage-inducible protein DinB